MHAPYFQTHCSVEKPAELSLETLCVCLCVQWFVWAWSDAFLYSVNKMDANARPTKDCQPAACGRTSHKKKRKTNIFLCLKLKTWRTAVEL